MCSQRIGLTNRVRILSHQEILGAGFSPSKERVLILHYFLQGCSIKWLLIYSFHSLFLIKLFCELDLVLDAILIGQPPEFLENATIAFENLSVDLRVLRCDLAVEV